MSQWTIGKRLVVGFCAVITVSVTLGLYASYAIVEIQKRAKSITEDALPGVVNIDKAMLAARANAALTLNHVMTDDPKRIAAIELEMTANSDATNVGLKAYESTIKEARDRELYAAVGGPRADVHKLRTVVLDLSRAGKDKEAVAAYERDLLPTYKQYFSALEALVEYNRKSGDIYAKEIDAEVNRSVWATVIGLVLVIALGGVAAWLVISTTNKALRTSVEALTLGAQQVVSASSQVASSSQALSQGATEQAAALEETSASMEEMASMTRQNAENAQTAAKLMTEVDTQVRDSNQALADMVTSMGAIRESSQRVAKIIKTIDEIAFQTNILALNAAVEAARAGEAGMGFAVVADEVRSLAQRSAQAAKDTAGLIEASIERSEHGNTQVAQVSSAISGITESVTKVKGLVEEVSLASRQQTQGIDQVSTAISQMEKVTQSTAATAEESAAASEELNAQADMSMGVVLQLESLVGGKSHGRPAEMPKPRRTNTNNVVSLAQARPQKLARSAEDELPLGDTGTFGKF